MPPGLFLNEGDFVCFWCRRERQMTIWARPGSTSPSMKPKSGSLLLLTLLSLLAGSALSQESRSVTNTPARRAERPPPLLSPELLDNGGVTFRLKAPKATEVKVSGQFGPDTAMIKDDKDVWSVTIPSVPAGVHEDRM